MFSRSALSQGELSRFSNGGARCFWHAHRCRGWWRFVSIQRIQPVEPFFPAIGYRPVNFNSKYVVTGPGAQANLGRNSVTTPGFTTLNLSLAKNINFGRSRSICS